MLGLRLLGVVLLTAFVLLNCGGSTTDSPGATGGGASSDGMECVGGAPAGGASDGGCGGDSGLQPYARLRTACSLNVRVNRRGKPVCIDLRIR